MTRRYSLDSIREVWVNAYFAGEVEWLAYLEVPSFIIVSRVGLTTKSEQIHNIERSKKAFPFGKLLPVVFEQTVLQTTQHEGWASVVGTVTSRRGEHIVSDINFSEIWLAVNNSWRIASLYTADRPSLPVA